MSDDARLQKPAGGTDLEKRGYNAIPHRVQEQQQQSGDSTSGTQQGGNQQGGNQGSGSTSGGTSEEK
jgi:hypothetical protein